MTAPRITDDPRMAGGVRRFHTWPSIQPQTVGQHSWDYVRILLAIWPLATRKVIIEALFHDVGEVAVGDVPYPVKHNNPLVGDAIEALEHTARLGMVLPWGVPGPSLLTEEEQRITKLAHMIEMWEFGLQEVMMGNRMMELVAQRCLEWVEAEIDRFPEGIVRANATEYVARRSNTWSKA